MWTVAIKAPLGKRLSATYVVQCCRVWILFSLIGLKHISCLLTYLKTVDRTSLYDSLLFVYLIHLLNPQSWWLYTINTAYCQVMIICLTFGFNIKRTISLFHVVAATWHDVYCAISSFIKFVALFCTICFSLSTEWEYSNFSCHVSPFYAVLYVVSCIFHWPRLIFSVFHYIVC